MADPKGPTAPKSAFEQTGGTAPAPQVAFLVELTGSQAGAHHRLEAECVIGRGADVHLRLSGREVSRQHARVARDHDGAYHVLDLGSRHGITVNGVPSPGQALRTGDRIGIGASTLLFTVRDRIEERMLHAQRMAALGRMAGGIAHDFNNLIAATTTNLTVLDRYPDAKLSDPEVAEIIRDCKSALERASALTKDLLGFARRGKLSSNAVPVDQLVESVLRLVRRSLVRGRYEVDVAPGLLVRGDASQLHQVLMNLCVNAQDALGEYGTIRISARGAEATERARLGLLPTEEAQVHLQVRDDGEGMDAETREQAFEPFFTTKPVGKGTGLGLASVYGIVEVHGGAVQIESAPGKGTTVHLFLPAAEVDHVDVVRTTDVHQPAVHRVLVVDDDALVRSSTGRLMRYFGYDVTEVDGGRAALAALGGDAGPFDVVLLDMRMPDMDGVETFEALRARAPKLPVVLVSATADEPRALELAKAAQVQVLSKPFDAMRLAEVLERALSSGADSEASSSEQTRRTDGA